MVRRMKAIRFSLLTLLALTLCCSAAEKLRVSSFSTILTEVAEQVGGDQVIVTGHVKPGVDPHEYEPKPGDLKKVGEAQVVLLSAKHMEGYVGKLKESTGTKGAIIEVGDRFASLKMKPEAGHEGHAHAHESDEDPHWWHSLACMQKAVKVVRDAFSKAAPESAAVFNANATKYLAKLDALQKWTRAELAKLPRDQRKLVTSHDAFQYFAKENGFTVYAIEGLSTANQPSSKKVAEIIAKIKAQGVKAIFPESILNPKVLTEITRETGAKVGGELNADGLGEGETSTYEGMYKHNVRTIVDGLK